MTHSVRSYHHLYEPRSVDWQHHCHDQAPSDNRKRAAEGREGEKEGGEGGRERRKEEGKREEEGGREGEKERRIEEGKRERER